MPKSTNPIPIPVSLITDNVDKISYSIPKSTNLSITPVGIDSDPFTDNLSTLAKNAIPTSLAISKCIIPNPQPNNIRHADVSPVKLNPTAFPSNNETLILPEDSPCARPSTTTESTLSHHEP